MAAWQFSQIRGVFWTRCVAWSLLRNQNRLPLFGLSGDEEEGRERVGRTVETHMTTIRRAARHPATRDIVSTFLTFDFSLSM